MHDKHKAQKNNIVLFTFKTYLSSSSRCSNRGPCLKLFPVLHTRWETKQVGEHEKNKNVKFKSGST